MRLDASSAPCYFPVYNVEYDNCGKRWHLLGGETMSRRNGKPGSSERLTRSEIDEIVRFTGLPARLVQIVLLELDLAGRIERHPGGRVSLA